MAKDILFLVPCLVLFISIHDICFSFPLGMIILCEESSKQNISEV